jgi:hypothetical protein
MSEATRNMALAHAVAHHGGNAMAPEVLGTAEAFHSFLTGSDAKPPAAAKPGTKPAGAAKPTKPAGKPPVKPAPQPDDAEETTEEQTEEEASEEEAAEETGPTKEDVGNAIASLINSNLKAECGKLLKSVGATSLSTVPPAKYAMFLAKAEELLMNA